MDATNPNPAGSSLPEHPELDFIQNDADCPLPTSGPRVTVGFWAATTQEEYDEGCACAGAPLFTIVYPVGIGDGCYGWKHMTSDPEDPVHGNSVTRSEWIDGRLEFTQYTVLCGEDRSSSHHPDGTPKHVSWDRGRDMPDYLFSKIIGVNEIPVDRLREGATITLRAVDGHFVSVDAVSSEATMWCAERVPSPSCQLVARFPGHVWDPRTGGEGDRGDCALEASNGRYLALHRSSDGRVSLRASATDLEHACLFSLVLEGQGVATLRTAREGLVLTHPCPGAGLELRAKPDPVYSRFNIEYRRG